MPRTAMRQAADRIRQTAAAEALAHLPRPERFRVTTVSPLELEGLETDTLLDERDEDVEVFTYVQDATLTVGDVLWVHPESGPDGREIARWNVISVVDAAAHGGGGPPVPVPDASATVKGLVKLSVPPVLPTNPIAVGDNDPRLGDSRPPGGSAGGDLTGSYPNPTLAAGAVTNAKVSAVANIVRSKLDFGAGLVNSDLAAGANIARSKLDFGFGLTNLDMAAANVDGLPTAPSLRTLGTGAQQAVAGNDPRLGDFVYVESFPRLAGETEDAPRINRAIAALPARGGTLLYAAIDYIINTGIVSPVDKPIRHQGAGMPMGDGGTSTHIGGTRLLRTSGTTTIFTCSGTGLGIGQRGMIELRDMGINGGGLAGIGVDVARVSNVWLDRVSIRSCVHTGLRMREVYNSGAGSLWISGCGAGLTNPAMLLDSFIGSSQGGVDTFSFGHVELEGNAGADLVLTGDPSGGGPTTNVSFGYLKFEGGWLAAAGCPYLDLQFVQSIHIARLNIAVHGNTAPEARTVTPFQMGSVGSSSAPCSIGSLQIGNTQAVDTPYVLQVSRGALQIDSFAASGFAGHLATNALIRLESTAGNDFQVGQVSTNFTSLPIFSDARSGGSQTTRTGAVKMRSQGALNSTLWESRATNAQNAWSLKADGWQDFGDGTAAQDVGHGRLTTAMWGLVTAGFERLRVNGSGNFGLGVPLSPWAAGLSPSIEYVDTAISFGDDTDFHLTSNAYFDGAWKYKTTDLGANYFMSKGTHTFRVAPSGTIDTAVTWTTRLAIDQTGLGFFGVTPAARPGGTTDLKAGLAALGLLTAGGASPLNLEGGQMTAGGGYRLGAALTGAAYQAQQVAGQPVLQNLLLGTDTKPAFRVLGEGTHAWGIGGTTDPDVSAYRQTSGGVSLQIDASGTGASLMLRNTNAAGYSGIEYRDNTNAAKMFSGYSNGAPTHFRFNAVGTPLRFMYSATTRLELDSTGLGFFGGTPVAKPTVTGSRGANAALASLLTALANLGLITDSST